MTFQEKRDFIEQFDIDTGSHILGSWSETLEKAKKLHLIDEMEFKQLTLLSSKIGFTKEKENYWYLFINLLYSKIKDYKTKI